MTTMINSTRKKVLIGILGSRLDSDRGDDRWYQWRPSVALCQHEDLLIDRFELLHAPTERDLALFVCNDIESVSPETQVNLHEYNTTDPWDFEPVFASLFEFATRYPFKTDDEDYYIHISTGTHVQQICLFLLAESNHLPGPLIQSSPAKRKNQSAGVYRVIDLDLSKYDAIATRFATQHADDLQFLKSGIETHNKPFNQMIEQIERVVVSSRSPVLLSGPTGAGKSQLARRIYELKRRREQIRGPLVEVNCATLRGDSAMSTLFGHIKGSFTGATTSRDGLLLSADTGLLFLDEIGELGLDEQAMLLRAIEDKRFMPVGSDKEVKSDFQLIAGTNRNLRQQIDQGTFREDLLARIDLWSFQLPGLAERREDIEPNLDYELTSYERIHGTRVTMNREARTAYLKFALSDEATWQSNFRDLSASVVRMSVLAHSGRITLTEVTDEIARLRERWKPTIITTDPTSLIAEVLNPEQITALDLFDRAQLETVLTVCHNSKSLSDAGRRLFAVSRMNKQSPNDADRIRKYLARFDITFEQTRFSHLSKSTTSE